MGAPKLILAEPSRRSFLSGLVALVAAPAIVRCASLMPVRSSRLIITDFTGLVDPAVVDVLYEKLQIGDILSFDTDTFMEASLKNNKFLRQISTSERPPIKRFVVSDLTGR